MSFYPDTNFILPLCVKSDDATRQKQVDRALRWLTRKEMPVLLSPLAEYETRKQLWGLPETARIAALVALEGLKTDWEKTVAGWGEAVDAALSIAETFRQKLHIDSADTLHVGWAECEQCSTFGTFDTNSGTKALAYARGLRVFPDMTEEDHAQLARIKP